MQLNSVLKMDYHFRKKPPSSDFGGSKSRLIQFYKSFGFKNYKGYEFRESMIRIPQ